MKKNAFQKLNGYISCKNGKLCRKISSVNKEDFELFKSSGLYKKLVEKKFIVPFEEENGEIFQSVPAFYSYSYEWSFSQLKDAALITLGAHKLALEHGMSINSLKCENVQFYGGKPALLDVLVFEKYSESSQWKVYDEFCRYFLAPLAIMSCTDIRLGQILKSFPHGIPLDLVCHILPLSANLNMGLVTHIYKHAKRLKERELSILNNNYKPRKVQISKLKEIWRSLTETVKALSFPVEKDEWGNYYRHTSYSDKAFFAKKEIITKYLDIVKPSLIFDLGSNRGKFSRIASNKQIYTVAFDIDAIAVEKNYLHAKKAKEQYILPLYQDLTNPSADMGFLNEEKISIYKRAKVDMVMVLALLPHLVICDGKSFEEVAEFLYSLAPSLIIEFIPADEKKVKTMLTMQHCTCLDYTEENFVKAFEQYFDIKDKQPVADTKRTLYLMNATE